MESLTYLKEYFLRLHFNKFNDFSEILGSLYPSIRYNDLDGKLELSLLINSENRFNLRFGLFKLHNPNTITSLFKSYGYDTPNLESSLSIMDGFAPEYGLGFDWNEQGPRLKTYFLRLQDNPRFKEEIVRKIHQLSELANIGSKHLQKLGKDNCYLIGIDYYRSKKRNLKIYTRSLDVNFSEISKQLEKNEINSEYIKPFTEVFSEKDLKDVTYSYKYSNQTDNLSGFSIFSEVKSNLNERVNKLIKTCFPKRFNEFRNLIGSLETDNNLVNYSHVGLTFSLGPNSGNVCLYYPPNFEGIKK